MLRRRVLTISTAVKPIRLATRLSFVCADREAEAPIGLGANTDSAEEILEPIRRHLGVANRVLDVSSEIGLQRSRVVPLVGRRTRQCAPVVSTMRSVEAF